MSLLDYYMFRSMILIIKNFNYTRVHLRHNLLYLSAFLYSYLMMTVWRSKHIYIYTYVRIIDMIIYYGMCKLLG